jgi:hypothetical protein
LPKIDPYNPVITVCWSEGVDHFYMTIKNTKGAVVHTQRIEITDEERASRKNCKDVEIRLDETGQPYGLPAGLYIGRVDAQDINNKNMGEPYYFSFYYKAGKCKENCDNSEPPKSCAGENCSGLPKEDPSNPVVTICYESIVTHVDIKVTSEATGAVVYINTIWLSAEDIARGCKDVELPLDGAGLPESLPPGWYLAEFTKRDAVDNQVGVPILRRIWYDGPYYPYLKVPMTGALWVGTTRVPRATLTISGLVLILVTAGGGALVWRRRARARTAKFEGKR